MTRVATSEFAVEIDADCFPSIRIFGTSIGARSAPQTPVSPALSIWTSLPEGAMSLAAKLSSLIEGSGVLIERRAVGYCGLLGELAICKDRLIDKEDNLDIAWYRSRVLLASPDEGSHYNATAMYAENDRERVETVFHRMLASIEVLTSGNAAVEVRKESDALFDHAFARLKENLDRTAEAHRLSELTQTRRSLASVDDIETRFDRALDAANLSHLREALRPLASSALVLVEAAYDTSHEPGRTRIGGGPDLPPDAEWPRDAVGLHLNFLAQINLADLPSRGALLPDAGLLSFFSGTDLGDGSVFYFPAYTPLVHLPLPPDAEDLASLSSSMMRWDSGAERLMLDMPEKDGLVATIESDGRVRFARDGAPVIALASEYEISERPQLLQVEPLLTLPNKSQAYAACGRDDIAPVCEAIRKEMRVGGGPQHRMFGHIGTAGEGEWRLIGRAVAHAQKSGWRDLAVPDGWFVLLALRSGGEANFSFHDHGTFVYIANARDTVRGDFSRVCAFVDPYCEG